MSSRRPPLRFDHAILCDDIRREDNNKVILIGIYSGDILVQKLPSNLVLAAWLIGTAYEEGEWPLEIRYKISAKDAKPRKVTASGNIGVKELKEATELAVPLAKVPLKIEMPGTLSLDYRISGGRWKKLLSKTIILQEASSSEP